MIKRLLSPVGILLVFLLSGNARIAAQCVGPLTVPIPGSGTGSALSATETHTDAVCASVSGSATITATGGTAPYSGTGTFMQLPGTQVYTVTDASGCMATVSVTIGVSDTELPTISCPVGPFVLTPNVGTCTLTLVSTEYNATGISDNCGLAGPATYSVISGNVTPSTGTSLAGAVLGVGNNVIQWKVTDVNGNMNTCQFIIKVNPCIQISGNLIWKGDGLTGVGNASVALSGSAPDTDGPTPAGPLPTGGAYSLVANVGGNFTVTPTKNINMFNGVDAADATAIQQHLTGIATITDFFRLVAADVNKSYSISNADATVLRQALLGNVSAVAIMNNTKSWRFIPTDYSYPAPAGPFSLPVFPEKRTLTGVTADLPNQDFWGVKVGDLTPVNATPANKSGDVVRPVVFRTRNRVLSAGETVDLDVSVQNFSDIAAYQFALRFDPTQLAFENIETLGKDLPLDASGNFGLHNQANGEIRSLWSAAQGLTINGTPQVFRLRFKALESGARLSDILQLDDDVLPAVAYTTALQPIELRLQFTEPRVRLTPPGLPGQPVPAELSLQQNTPNPFSGQTRIGFVLPDDCDASLRILDVSGREIYLISRSYSAGYNEEIIDLEQVRASGVLSYELVTPFGTQTRKMILTKN